MAGLSEDVRPGDVLGRYELLVPVAKGGMAQVWAARLTGTRGFQKLVAVKTMLPSMSDDPRFEQMFLDEASLAARIRHPNVAEILDLGEEQGVLYIVMEWVDGEPLNLVLRHAYKAGGIPLPIGVRIASQACGGLHAAHELKDDDGALVGLVHRDVSPHNVLVTYEGVVKVVDFGVAKAKGRASGETGAGQIKGKLSYMSPEQVTSQRIDRRTDVFALGILLYMLTTGKHPLRGDNEATTIRNIMSTDKVPPPSRLVTGYPPGLQKVVMKALEKAADARYQTANLMLRDLDKALPSSMVTATDEDVGNFLRELLPSRLEHRKQVLGEALKIANQRATDPGVRPAPGEPEETSEPSSLSGIEDLDGAITGIEDELQKLDEETSSPSTGSLTGAGVVAQETTLAGEKLRVPKRRPLLKVGAVAGTVATATIGFVVLTSGEDAPPDAPAAAGSTLGSVELAPAPVPSARAPATPSTSARVEASSDVAGDAAGAAVRVAGDSEKKTRALRAARQLATAKATPRAPRPRNTPRKKPAKPFVSPIRNPGF